MCEVMTKARTLIIADDLTGANDTAIQFRKHGFSTLVVTGITQADKCLFNDYDVVSINSDSRRMYPDDAYRVVHDTVKVFDAGNNGSIVYKKIDSLLRGNPGQELAAVMDALDSPLALVAPAFPANHSILENGRLPSGLDVVRIFAAGSGRKTENIPIDTIRKGATFIVTFIQSRISIGTQIFVADAVSDNNLKTIYHASLNLTKAHVLAGSAGLANQVACNQGQTEDVNEKLTIIPPTLVVAGSRQAVTAMQLLLLSDHLSTPFIRLNVSLIVKGKSDEAIENAFVEAAEHIHHANPVCIIILENLFDEKIADQHLTEREKTGIAIADALGMLTKKLLDNFHFSLLVGIGGDTSMGICRHAGIAEIEPVEELYPGIPLAKIVGGINDGRYMITKSGRFGKPYTLINIFKRLGLYDE